MFKFTATGVIDEIGDYQKAPWGSGRTFRTLTISERWGKYPATLRLEFWGRDADKLNGFKPGDDVEVEGCVKSNRRTSERGTWWNHHVTGFGIQPARVLDDDAPDGFEDDGVVL